MSRRQYVFSKFTKNECAICLGTMFLKNNKMLVCKHRFHKNCIEMALAVNHRCPLCNKSQSNTNMDPTTILFNAIVDQDQKTVKEYVSRKDINWHKTFSGETLSDTAKKTGNIEIIDLMIKDKAISNVPLLYPRLQ